MTYSNNVRKETLKSLSDVKHIPFWLDDPLRPAPEPSLTKETSTDLLIIGAGYSGLWRALLAKEENPNRDIIILEAGEVAIGASGRNGGFMDASLTHGFCNGLSRWPRELPTLLKMGFQNLNAIEETLERYNIACDYMRTGVIGVATESLAEADGLVTLPCYEWQHVALVPPGHALAKLQRTPGRLTLKDLARHPIVTYEVHFSGRSRIDAAFAAAGIEPSIVLEAIDADVIN